MPFSDKKHFFNKVLESLIDGSEEAVGCFDLDFKYITFNQKHLKETESTYGITLQHGMSIQELMKDHPDDLSLTMGLWERTLKGEKFSIDSTFGSLLKTYRIRFAPLIIDGEIVGGVHYAKDVSVEIETKKELHRQELILKTFFDESPQLMGIVQVVDNEIVHLSDNPAAAQFFGRPVDFLKNRTSTELGIPPEINQKWVSYYLMARSTGQNVKFEYDHEGRSFRVTITYLGEENANPLFSYFIEDLTLVKLNQLALSTTNKQLIDELRLKEAQHLVAISELGRQRSLFETIMQTSSDVIYVKDENSRMIYLNQAAVELIQRPESDIIGRNDLEFLGPGNGGEQVLENDRRIITSGKAEVVEEKIFDKIYLSSKAPYKDNNGKIIGLLGISKEITDIKKSEAQLRVALEENELLLKSLEFEKNQSEAILNQMPAAVIVGQAPSGKLIYANPKMEEVWGFPLKKSESIDEYNEWVGFHPDGSRYLPHEWPLARSLTTGEIVTDEDVEIIRYDSRAILRLSSCPIRSNTGEIMAGIVICQDVTELVLAVRSRDEFLSIASHELKTPLTSLKLQAQMMKKDLENEQVEVIPIHKTMKLVVQLDRQTTRLNKIVDDMLDIARVRTGKLKLSLSEFDLCQLVQDVVNNMKLQQPDIQIILKEKQEVYGTWDVDRLEQVLMNLISNGIKYGLGKPVEVSLKKDEKNCYIDVKDFGLGIESEKQSIIFEKFERGGIQTKDIGGLGIGLFISKQIILSHGGKIEVQSEINKGSVFKVTLPLTSLQADISVCDYSDK